VQQEIIPGGVVKKRNYDGWVMVNPKGQLQIATFAQTKDACWFLAFERCFEAAFVERYWKRLAASQAAAQRAGWRMVKVKLEPIG
jgi:hypothetical protein